MSRSGWQELLCGTVAAVVVVASACASLGPDGLSMSVTVENAVASSEAPATIRVVASNVGLRRATWGPGSSTCQLLLQVRVEGAWRFATIEDRVCTMDMSTHVLEPGQSRVETVRWTGRVQLGDGPIVALEPGTYQVRGVAPPSTVSVPASIGVVE